MKRMKWIVFAVVLMLLPGCGDSSMPTSDQGALGPFSDSDIIVATDIEKTLTPENATVQQANGAEVTLTSTDSLEDIKAFYLEVLADMGAEELSSSDEDGWHYTGMYDNGKSVRVDVSLPDGAGIITIQFVY